MSVTSAKKLLRAEASQGGAGERKRVHILEAALRLMRRKGIAATTMREIAAEAGVALGAAYHYFPSKEAFVFAWYEKLQDEHLARVRAAWKPGMSTRERLGIVIHTKLDVLRPERKMMRGLMNAIGDPDDPVSIFGDHAKKPRDASYDAFDEALESENLDDDLRQLTVVAFWALHMGILLYFLHDKSKSQEKTARLVDGALDQLVPLLAMSGLFAGLVGPSVALLRDAGLMPPTGPSRIS